MSDLPIPKRSDMILIEPERSFHGAVDASWEFRYDQSRKPQITRPRVV